MVCQHCRHANPDTGRFCGKCGQPLARHEISPTPVPPRISGPSFLGLAGESESDSVSYLLDDDAPSRSRGPIFLTFILLAVIGGLGYLYWHNVYAPLAYVQPPAPRSVPPPAFAYDPTPPLAIANAQLSTSMTILAPLDRSASDRLILQRLAEDEKAASDPHSNPNLVTGEKYLYGRGVSQSCRQAVEHFQAAAKQDNAPALTHLAVMSASGHCMKLDRVAAYQWFARAKQADPDDPWLDRSMDMLWANMSHRERTAVMK